MATKATPKQEAAKEKAKLLAQRDENVYQAATTAVGTTRDNYPPFVPAEKIASTAWTYFKIPRAESMGSIRRLVQSGRLVKRINYESSSFSTDVAASDWEVRSKAREERLASLRARIKTVQEHMEKAVPGVPMPTFYTGSSDTDDGESRIVAWERVVDLVEHGLTHEQMLEQRRQRNEKRKKGA
jgi:hypothetical protein